MSTVAGHVAAMAAGPASPSAVSSRNRALDIAKGIAIIAVVASHAMRGAHNDALIDVTTAYRLADTTLYLFHVQLFLLVSGYLAFPRAAEPRLQRNRQISLAYAYFLWSTLSLVALIATHDHLPAQDIPHSFLALFYAPIQHFWFLPVIMIGFAMLYLLRTRLSLAVAIMACILFPMLFGFSYYGLHYYLPFYFAGALLRLAPPALNRPQLLTVASTILFVGGVGLAMLLPINPPTVPVLIPSSLAGCYMVYRIAQATERWAPLARGLEVAGQASLPIFLTHIFFTAGVRRVGGMVLGPVDVDAMIALTLAAGVVGPIVLDHLAHRLNVQRWIGFTPLLK